MSTMASFAQDTKSIALTIPSDLALLHPLLKSCESFVQGCGFQNSFHVSLVLQELLANAIQHGNNNNAERMVACNVTHICPGQFEITVEDEGEGFDFLALNTTLPDNPRAVGPRGYILIKNLCSALEFNERGNRITALVSLAVPSEGENHGNIHSQPGN